MLVSEQIALGKEKWHYWNTDHWVCEAADGEVIDEITRGALDGLFLVKSSGKRYTDLKKAQEASAKHRLTALKKFHEDLLTKKGKEDERKDTRGRGVRRAGKENRTNPEDTDFEY